MNNSYKKLDVYVKARQLVVTVYALLKHYPTDERYALIDQMRRAVISVPFEYSRRIVAFGNQRTSTLFRYSLWLFNGGRLLIRYIVRFGLYIQGNERNVKC